MKLTNQIGIGLVGICALLLLGSPTYAGTWTTTGGTCTVGENSLDEVRLRTFLSFEVTEIGVIFARCNIVDVEDRDSWDTLVVTYDDPDGPGPDYRVRVTLYAVEQEIGRQEEIVVFDSNDQNITGRGNGSVNFRRFHDFDFDVNAYYLFVVLRRANTDANPKFYRAEIN